MGRPKGSLNKSTLAKMAAGGVATARSLVTSQTQSASQPQQQQKRGRPRDKTKHLPKGKLDCCGDELPYEDVVACEGPLHKKLARWCHASCVNISDASANNGIFQCDDCAASLNGGILPSSPPTAAGSPSPSSGDDDDGDDDEATGSDDEDDDYGPIIDDRWNPAKPRWEYYRTPPNSKLERWYGENRVDDDAIADWEEKMKADAGQIDSDDEDDGEAEGSDALTCDINDEASCQVHASFDNPFWRYLLLGYWSIIKATWESVKDHAATAALPSLDDWHELGMEILAPTPFKVLVAALGAGLTRMKQLDAELMSDLVKIRLNSADRPCIYLLELTDKQGFGPTMDEMRLIIDRIRRYMEPRTGHETEDVELAIAIDSVCKKLDDDGIDKVQAGQRRYIEKASRRKTTEDFCDNLERELNKLSTLKGDERVPFLLRDVGYTNNGPIRLEKQHFVHSSSLPLMNLVEATSIECLGGDYRIQGDVVFLSYAEDHAAAAEVFWSVIANVYVASGRGFNDHPAGLNMGDHDRYVRDKRFHKFRWQTLNETPFYENIRTELDRVANYKYDMEVIDYDIKMVETLTVNDRIEELNELKRLEARRDALLKELVPDSVESHEPFQVL